MNLYVFGGVLFTIFLVYRGVVSYIQQRAIDRARAESDKKQQQYVQDVSKLEEEIKNAKLTYDRAKQQLDSDSNIR